MSLSLKTTAMRARLWFCHSLEWLPPVTCPGPLREVLAVIQAGLPGSVGGHVFSFAAHGCLVVRCYRPHRGGRLFCLTRCALPRRQHLAAPSLTPFTHFGGWRRFPALRAVDHCTRLLLCSMREGDVKAPVVTALGNSMFPSIFCTAYPLRLIDWAQTLSRRSGAFASRGANIRTWDAERHAVGRPS